MSKVLKVLTMSLLLASIMIATVGSVAFADDGGKQVRNCTCEFVDCDCQGPPWAGE